MAEELNDPIATNSTFSKNKTLLIVLLVLIFLCCCCCGFVAALYYGIEPMMMSLGVDIPWYP